MNETIAPKPKPKGQILVAWQITFVIFSAVLVAALLGIQRKLNAPGAPVELFWTAVVLGGLVAVAHWPFIFTRLPGHWKGIPYMASIGFMFLMGYTFTRVDAAWERTPRGAAEAKQAEAESKAFDIEWERNQRAETEAEARRKRDGASSREAENLQEQAQEQAAKLDDCFTTFGHRLPALEDPFKEALHNPGAYEHVETLAIAPDFEGHNVAMKFRAENGMGAIRLGAVTAKVDPESCEIVEVGDPEIM